MNPAHAHLLINHLPIIGAFLAVPLVIIALWKRRQPLLFGAATLVLVCVGFGAAVALATGEPAEHQLEQIVVASEATIETHEERAGTAGILAIVTGLGALATALWSWRRGAVPAFPGGLVLAGTVITAGAMAWTGAAGGLIRHTEIQGDAAAVVNTEDADDD
jgi:hypothetical protein